jgi:hypothetical protein
VSRIVSRATSVVQCESNIMATDNFAVSGDQLLGERHPSRLKLLVETIVNGRKKDIQSWLVTYIKMHLDIVI